MAGQTMQYSSFFGPVGPSTLGPLSMYSFLRKWFGSSNKVSSSFHRPIRYSNLKKIISYHQAVAHEITLAFTPSQPRRKSVDRPLPRPPAHLPNELVIAILEAGYSTHDGEPDRQFLQQCSLVCKDWSVPAQQLLFRDVVLRTQPAYAAFQQAVDQNTPRACMFANAVKTLRVTLDHNHPQCLTERAFARAVTLAPRLHTLRVAVYGQGAPGQDIIGSPAEHRMRRGAPSFDDKTLDILREQAPRIKSLHFNDWSDNSTSLVQLLQVWPSIRALEISGTPPTLPSPAPEPCLSKLEELHFDAQTPPSIEFLKWLTHNSAETLRVLDLRREPSHDTLEYLLGEHSGTLESLSVPSAPAAKVTVNLLGCLALKELRVENTRAARQIFNALPEGLEHLALGVHEGVSLQPVIQFIKKSNTLQTLTMHLWYGAEHHDQLAAVKIACAVRGVELRISKNLQHFRSTTVCYHTRCPDSMGLIVLF